MWENMAYGNGDGYGWMHGDYWLGMGLHGLFWVLLVAAVALTVMWTARAALPRNVPAPGHGNRSSRELLDDRYARGEIDRDEYLARKRDMKT